MIVVAVCDGCVLFCVCCFGFSVCFSGSLLIVAEVFWVACLVLVLI